MSDAGADGLSASAKKRAAKKARDRAHAAKKARDRAHAQAQAAAGRPAAAPAAKGKAKAKAEPAPAPPAPPAAEPKAKAKGKAKAAPALVAMHGGQSCSTAIGLLCKCYDQDIRACLYKAFRGNPEEKIFYRRELPRLKSLRGSHERGKLLHPNHCEYSLREKDEDWFLDEEFHDKMQDEQQNRVRTSLVQQTCAVTLHLDVDTSGCAKLSCLTIGGGEAWRKAGKRVGKLTVGEIRASLREKLGLVEKRVARDLQFYTLGEYEAYYWECGSTIWNSHAPSVEFPATLALCTPDGDVLNTSDDHRSLLSALRPLAAE